MLHYVVSNLIFNEKLKSATHSIEEIEHVCMLDVLIKKVCFVSSVSVEMTKVNALNKDKTVLLSCFKLAYLVRRSTFGIGRLFTSDRLSLQLNSGRGNLRRQKSGILAIYILRVSTRLLVSD